VAESDRYRHEIAGELDNLQGPADWLERGFSLTRYLRSSWPLIAALAGFLISRRRRPAEKGHSSFRKLRKLWSWWRRYQTLASLWRRFGA